MNEKELALDFAQLFEPMVNSIRDNGAESCVISVNNNGLVSVSFYGLEDGKFTKAFEEVRYPNGEVKIIREEKLEVENGL